MTDHPIQRPIPINEAEAIIEPFWDQHLSPLDAYALNAGIGADIPAECHPRALQFWCWVTLKWDRAPVGTPIVRFERDLAVDLAGYDCLLIRLGMPEHVRLHVDAVVDGQAQRLLTDAAGTGGPHEFEMPVAGRVLEHVAITLTSARDQADEAWLQWIGLAHAVRRAAMLTRPNPFDAGWAPWLLPADAEPALAPRFGFFFGADDLPAIRRRAASPAYRPLMDQLRERAQRALAFHKTPEDQVGDTLGTGEIWKIQARERDWDTYPFFSEAPVIAFVGLVDEDKEMLRFAARIAVATAHCRSWAPHFMQDFPGSTWDTRAFPEAHAAAGIALALDWAGGWFTDPGEHLIRYALTHKALGRVRGIFLQYDYMWDCNQHHLIGLGRLLALLVQVGAMRPPAAADNEPSPALAGKSPDLKLAWERARADIDQFERDLFEMIDRYIQPDGSSFEGVGYWGASFQTTLPALLALARHRGVTFPELLAAGPRPIADKLARMWNFVSPLLATAGEAGAFLPISDTSFNLLPWDVIGTAAAALEQQGWQGLLGACLGGGKTTMVWPYFCADGPFTMIFGPDDRPAPTIDVPVFRRLETAGMITSNRPWGVGNVRLHLVGAMANAGHCHPDKGSFILEAGLGRDTTSAGGDTFGGDRGVTPYVDPRCRTLASEVAHNLAVPEGCFQVNPAPVAALWQGEGDEERLAAEIDTSAIWQAHVRIARRRIHSPQPELIEIEDEFELDDVRTVTFYLNTPLPIALTPTLPLSGSPAQATIEGMGARLTVTAEWAAHADAGEYYSDFAYRPWNRLAITSAPATRHLLKTVLRFDKD